MSDKLNAEALAVTLTIGQLKRLVRTSIEDALEEHDQGAAPKPEVMTRERLAQALDISTVSVSRLVSEGMPYLSVGDHKRFRLADVMKWLEGRAKGRAQSDV